MLPVTNLFSSRVINSSTHAWAIEKDLCYSADSFSAKIIAPGKSLGTDDTGDLCGSTGSTLSHGARFPDGPGDKLAGTSERPWLWTYLRDKFIPRYCLGLALWSVQRFLTQFHSEVNSMLSPVPISLETHPQALALLGTVPPWSCESGSSSDCEVGSYVLHS
ncbi:phospholipid-transporting ATPase IG [Platysternon megacephalum]|uniref:Phospholipid-transporting ATPase IG n=1 Tax=Platysternon megacephalum TaxID=55544 RepID=A0A4D9EY14_9SAUR|nr:phospholipid-transporting ATPase IG [Platysternon megacephalum]